VDVVTPALERVIEANILLSGVGSENGGLAAVHSIHNGLTTLESSAASLHGEKVAFSTLAALFLADKPAAVIDEVYGFCEAVGLPTTLAAIGLGGVSNEDLLRVAEVACAEGETIHNLGGSVSVHAVYAAIKTADLEGRRRQLMVEMPVAAMSHNGHKVREMAAD
jgi:glycerol dehydrogenase